MSEESTRIESGPVQFGDDWPGLFIRGDNAFMYGQMIEAVLKLIEDGEQIGSYNSNMLEGLKDGLLGVNVARNPTPTKLLPYTECVAEKESRIQRYSLEQLLPRIQYPGWQREPEAERRMRGVLPDGAEMAFFTGIGGLRVMLTLEEGVWLHLSVSRANVLPTWEELKEVRRLWLGDRFAVQIFPPKAHWLNLHEHTLHLFCRVDDEPIIPAPLWSNPHDAPEDR